MSRDSYPFKGSPLIKCPITGFYVNLDEAKWNGHEWVHPSGYDEPGFREKGRQSPRPHPLHLTRSRRVIE